MDDDRNTLALMVTLIYATRLHSFMTTAGPKTKDSWHTYRKQAIEVSITDAVMICEQIERDFPTHR